MNRPQTKHFTLMLFTVSLTVWVLAGGTAFAQTQAGDTPDPPSTVQEEPGTSEEQGEVIERGIMRRDNRVLPGLLPPKATPPTPPAPKVVPPSIGGLSPSATLSKGDRYTAPTPSLTIVANALQLRVKSLSTVIAVRPGLVLTNPVNIKITYKSPVSGSRWIQDLYNPTTGFRKFHNDVEGDRSVRQMIFDILLTERLPDNQVMNFSITWQANLDPLFDVTITPLRFTLTTNCDRVGKSEIEFKWYSPGGQFGSKSFSTSKGKLVAINEFAWTKQEFSASANRLWPTWAFIEKDTQILHPQQWSIPKQELKLLPTTVTGFVGRNLKEASGKSGCAATTAFDVTVKVRQYPNL